MKKIYYPLIYKIIIINFFFFLFLNFESLANYKKLFDPVVPDEIYIDLKKKQLVKYANNIYEIQKDKGVSIHPKFKEYFNGKISFKQNNYYKKYKVKLRIVGDWKDHTIINNLTSSLQIKLEEGHIGGITQFRIYLPKTRKGSNEILWSIIHENLGFPTLYRKMINVNVNNNTYKAIFEELPSKEFMERWSIRESPIIEYDERQLWLDRYYEAKKVQNLNIKRYKIDNTKFIKSNIDTLIAQKSFKISQNKIIDKFEELNNEVASHALVKHNRKFIYDPIYNIHLPLYFDGMVEINENNACELLDLNAWKNSNDEIKNVFKKILLKYKNRILNKSHKIEECFIKKILLEKYFDLKEIINSEILNSIENKDNLSYKFEPLDLINRNILYYGYDLKLSKFCISKFVSIKDCEDLNFDEIRNLFSGKLNLERKNIPFNIGFYNNKTKSNFLENKLLKIKLKKDITINTQANKNYYIKIEKKNLKNLNVNLNLSKNSRIIIFDSVLKNINISLNENKDNFEKNKKIISRYNQNLLTGCLTIIDSRLKNLNLKSNGTNCEDDINIVRSVGEIDNVNISNSSYDAIDLDFSNLKIYNINIMKSGNDCMDFSFGNYIIYEANLTNCKDKAISVGEKSNFIARNIDIKNSLIGLANKDSSVTYINNIKTTNVKSCLDNYKKKREFDLGYVYLVNKTCEIKKIKNLNFIDLENFEKKFAENEKTRI
jgi:hypothetical protein